MSSRAAPSATRRSNRRRRARSLKTRDRRRGGDRVVGEQRLDGARLPLGAQFWRGVGEPGRPARQVLRQVEGGERRARVASATSLPQPASPGRGRRPSPAPRRANSSLARSGSGVGQPRVLASAASAPKIASGSASARSAVTAAAAAAAAIGAGRPRPPASRSAAASSAAFSGSSGACRSAATADEPLGAEGIAGTAERAERGIDPSRRPELLAGLGEGDRVAQRRLVLAPVEQVLRHRGGAFQRQAAAPDAGPRRVGSGDGIEGGRAPRRRKTAPRPRNGRETTRPGAPRRGRGAVRRGRARRESSPES